MHHDRKRLRREMRARRRLLTAGERQRAAQRLARRLRASTLLYRARRVGLYLPADGEIDPWPALRRGTGHRQCFLPVLDPLRPGILRFAPWTPGRPMRANRFGIPEPRFRYSELVPVWSLDLILMPLVAWDRHGNRLGMGGGFYDRTLADMDRRPLRPRLAGVAYRFQEVPRLESRWWDVPLDGVLTD